MHTDLCLKQILNALEGMQKVHKEHHDTLIMLMDKLSELHKRVIALETKGD